MNAVTIPEIQSLMDNHQISSETLVWLHLGQIAEHNKCGVSINALMEVNPEAALLAAASDRQRAERARRGPLHGIPILLKDNIDTCDKMHTSGGTLALANSRPLRDASLVTRLRKAGAIILGKASLTELANAVSNNMPPGYSARGGLVRNPYGPEMIDVGGSSSGSAAAVAANMAIGAIGTETAGSILNPASLNSLVGIKPTVGLVSRKGIIPISQYQDTAGPIARTVTDAAILLGSIVGPDSKDPATLAVPSQMSDCDYTRYLDANGLKDRRLGVLRMYLEDLKPSQLSVMEDALAVMMQLGATVVDPADISDEAIRWQSCALSYEFKPAFNAYLSGLRREVSIRSLGDLIEYNFKNVPATLVYGQDKLIRSEETSGTLMEAEYIEARRSDLVQSRKDGIDKIMDRHNLDALIFLGSSGSGLAGKAGYPSITIPAGYDDAGIPLGLTLAGKAFQEPQLIEMAYAFEQATHHRVPPRICGE